MPNTMVFAGEQFDPDFNLFSTTLMLRRAAAGQWIRPASRIKHSRRLKIRSLW
jgi:hypothetical protein